jgi:subtilisin-like proprotein convertase family protein
VDASTGPFRLTSQTSDEFWSAGQQINITWDVAGTDGGNVNCSTVDLILSTDGGQNFTDTLAAGIPNNGNYTLTVPSNLQTPEGRLMLKAVNNYFFSLSQGTIRIGNYNETCGNNYSSSPSIAIPDNDMTGIADTIHVPENRYITDLNVHVDITHPYIRDLKVSIISPAGTEVILWNHNCGNEDNLQLVFDDDGNTPDCSNLTGNHIIPQESLSNLNGEYSQGDWILKVSDNASPDSGTLNNWSLEFCYLVGVDKDELKNVKIYPNPNNGIFRINFPAYGKSPVRMEIFDINGRELFSHTYQIQDGIFDKTVNLHKLASGNYIIKIKQGNKFYNGIIIVR